MTKTFTHMIEQIAEDYVNECLAEGAEIVVEGRNKLNFVQVERLMALATQDDVIRSLIMGEIKERMMDKIDSLKLESYDNGEYDEIYA